MENTQNEAVVQKTEKKGKRQAPGSGVQKGLTAAGAILAVVLAAYLGLCAWATHHQAIWKGTCILGQELGGLTVDEAVEKVEASLPELQIGLYLYDGTLEYAPDRGDTPDAAISLADLDARIDVRSLVQGAHDFHLRSSFFTAGWRYLTNTGVIYYGGGPEDIAVDAAAAASLAEEAAGSLSWAPRNTSFATGESSLSVQTAQDGRRVSAEKLLQGLEQGYWTTDLGLDVPYAVEAAKTLTAQEIYDEVSGEVKNAGYDAASDTIIPEQVGAEFDVKAAQALLDAAAPGETVEIPAAIEYPTVTAEELESVLFRDVLGEARTKVSGTAARKSNVNLSASAINGLVLNAGDIFSYNESVGQRTAARGYKPAPAYVQGETVDEIGGGICQTSSTLYLACLRSNLEITERYAHRYIPTYIAAGMDATVSWGGPDYKFTNNTDYPIKIVTEYEGGYLTVRLLGTNVTGVTAKMTNELLSSSSFEVVYEDDPTLAPGTEQVKTTPYAGSKWRTYRHLYDADGNLISSAYEATSDYKSRNKVILRGPVAADPSGGTDPEAADPGAADSGTTDSGTTVPGSGDPDTADPGGADPDPAVPGIIVVEPELGPADFSDGADLA